MRSLFQRFDITDESGRVTSYVVRVAGSKDEDLEVELNAVFELLKLDSKIPFKGKLLEVVKVFGSSFANKSILNLVNAVDCLIQTDVQEALRNRKTSSLLAPGLAGLFGFEHNNQTTGKANGKKMLVTLANVAALEKGLGSIMGDHFKAHVVPVGAGETAALIADQAAAQFERLRSELAASSAKSVEMHTKTQALVATEGAATRSLVAEKVDETLAATADVDAKVEELLEGQANLLQSHRKMEAMIAALSGAAPGSAREVSFVTGDRGSLAGCGDSSVATLDSQPKEAFLAPLELFRAPSCSAIDDGGASLASSQDAPRMTTTDFFGAHDVTAQAVDFASTGARLAPVEPRTPGTLVLDDGLATMSISSKDVTPSALSPSSEAPEIPEWADDGTIVTQKMSIADGAARAARALLKKQSERKGEATNIAGHGLIPHVAKKKGLNDAEDDLAIRRRNRGPDADLPCLYGTYTTAYGTKPENGA